jgi:hypothetical protein
MKTVKRTMYYPTFNAKQNEFDYKEVTHERAMTDKELTVSIKYYLSCWLCVATIVVYALGLILSLAIAITWEDLILIPISIAWAYLISEEVKYCFRLEDKVESFNDYGFDTEILQWEQITQEQNIIAQEWRAEHPLEEAIRKAQLSKNSVDIAALARLYAQEIRGE